MSNVPTRTSTIDSTLSATPIASTSASSLICQQLPTDDVLSEINQHLSSMRQYRYRVKQKIHRRNKAFRNKTKFEMISADEQTKEQIKKKKKEVGLIDEVGDEFFDETSKGRSGVVRLTLGKWQTNKERKGKGKGTDQLDGNQEDQDGEDYEDDMPSTTTEGVFVPLARTASNSSVESFDSQLSMETNTTFDDDMSLRGTITRTNSNLSTMTSDTQGKVDRPRMNKRRSTRMPTLDESTTNSSPNTSGQVTPLEQYSEEPETFSRSSTVNTFNTLTLEDSDKKHHRSRRQKILHRGKQDTAKFKGRKRARVKRRLDPKKEFEQALSKRRHKEARGDGLLNEEVDHELLGALDAAGVIKAEEERIETETLYEHQRGSAVNCDVRAQV